MKVGHFLPKVMLNLRHFDAEATLRIIEKINNKYL